MPFLKPSEDEIALRGNDAVAYEPDMPMSGLVGAAARQENTIWSTVMKLTENAAPPPEAGHNSLDTIKDTKYEQQYLDRFVSSRSKAEDQQIMARIDREEKDRQIIASNGIAGTALSMVMGLADPTILLPGGEFYRAARGGFRIGRTALSVGAAAGAQAALQEGVLQGTQETRSGLNSVINIGSATLLGSLIGGGAASLLTNVERRAAVKALDDFRVNGALPNSAGAAAADTRTMQLSPMLPGALSRGYAATKEAAGKIPYIGRFVEGVVSLPERAVIHSSPFTRLATSMYLTSRRMLGDLAESALKFTDAERGVTPSRFSDGAIDRVVKDSIRKTADKITRAIEASYNEYRFGDANMRAGAIRGDIARLRGDKEFMTASEFRQEVGKAMSNFDKHENPHVEAVAKLVRKEVFEPWKLRGQQAGVFPKEMTDNEWQSYFSRVWNKEAITANFPAFIERQLEYLKGDQAKKAAIQEQLASLNTRLQEMNKTIGRIDARLQTKAKQMRTVGAALEERAIEVRAAQKRFDALAERRQFIKDAITDINDFIKEAEATLKSPEFTDELKALREIEKELRAAEKAETVSEADLRKQDQIEVNSLLTGAERRGAEIFLGKRKLPKAKGFLAYLRENGGIDDLGGDVASVLGGKKLPGLIRKVDHSNDGGAALPGMGNGRSNARIRGLDAWGEKLGQDFRDVPEFVDEFPNVLQTGRLEPDQVLDLIRRAENGEVFPWLQGWSDAERQAIAFAAMLDKMQSSDVQFNSMSDIAELLNGRSGQTAADLEARLAEMEAAGASVPMSFERDGVTTTIEIKQADIAKLRETIAAARKNRAALEAKGVKQGVAKGEAGVALNRSAGVNGRMSILQRRLDSLDAMQSLLQRARDNAENVVDEVRAKIEEQIKNWDGDSSVEAKMALKARDEQAQARGAKIASGSYKGKGGRLRGADGKIDAAVKKILKSERTLTDAELRSRAMEIAGRIVGSPDGRLAYDAHSGGPVIGAPRSGPPPRGPMAYRDYAIPDSMVMDFKENDVEKVMLHYLRTVVPDVLLTERMGDVELSGMFKQLESEYSDAANKAATPEERNKLRAQYDADVRDLAAVRDRIRNVFGWDNSAVMRNAGRMAEAIKSYNVLVDMGGMVLSQLPDLAGTVFRWGLSSSFKRAWAPYAKYLAGGLTDVKTKQELAQLRAMGIGIETYTQLRSHDINDLTSVYQPRSIAERTLQVGANKLMVANLAAPATDGAKLMAGSVAMHELLRLSELASKGDKKAISRLAEAYIDPQMAGRIWDQFSNVDKTSYKDVEGGLVPNLDDWTDAEARNAFETAVNREVDIAVISPGQEKPLLLSQPVMGILGQFKTFASSATVRIMLANMQKRDAAALQGLITSIALGSLSGKLYAVVSGRDTSNYRPQDWIKEGISRGGVLGWLDEFNSISAKATGGTLDAYRLIGADKPLNRYASRSILGALLGPTAGKVESFTQVARAMSTGEASQADLRAARRLVPLQNLFYLRQLFDQVEKSGADILNLPETRKQ